MPTDLPPRPPSLLEALALLIRLRWMRYKLRWRRFCLQARMMLRRERRTDDKDKAR
jgi:hypothetical protein